MRRGKPVEAEDVSYGPVYTEENARYQQSTNTTKSFLLDEIYDYFTQGVYPVRLKDRIDQSSRRRDFRAAAAR